MTGSRKSASRVEWRVLGERDPLWAVSTWDGKRKGDANSWTIEEFNQVGGADWADFREQWRQYGVAATTCVEIGCGAGRITRWLCSDFEMVHAIDVSEAMIRWAARNVEAGQVKFHATDGIEIPLPNDSVDAVFSVHVFQHLDSKADAAAYVAEIGRVLAPGGTVMLHFPILILPGRGAARRIVRAVLRIREYLGGVRAKLARGLLRIGIGKPIMRMLAYEDGWVFSEFSRASLESVELRVFRVRSNQQLHSFFLARKTIRPNRPGGDGV